MCCRQFSLNFEVDLDNDPGTFGGSATNRKCTDVFGFLIMVLFLGAVIGLSVYCILNSDVEKLTNGYDDNGNVCGRQNIKTDSIPFENFGENMEQKKYVLIKEDAALGKTKECIENCTMKGIVRVSNYCVFDEKLIPYYIGMLQYWKFVIASWIFGVILMIDPTVILKKPKLLMQFAVPLFLSLLLLLSWYAIAYIIVERKYYYFKVSIILAIIITIAFLSYMPNIRTKQQILKQEFSSQLCQEAMKVFDVTPLTKLLPILSSILIAGFTSTLIYCWIWLQSFSYLDQINNGSSTTLEYVQYPIATVTGALAIYAWFLLYEIVKNCQCMIIGGYVAQLYFKRTDAEISNPLKRAIVNLLKYHLGTICCGSIILPVVYVLRAVLNAIKGAASGYNKESVYTCSCRLLSETCLAAFITCLDCFSQNGFIMTAMYGCSYCKGTIRAHKLLSHNIFNLASINALGNYFLDAFKFVATIGSIALLIIILFKVDFNNEKHLPILIIFYITLTYIFKGCIMSGYKVAIDTLFLCFCEDILYNNGTAKPYYASSIFAQFIEEANKFVDPVKWKEVAEKWEKGPKRLY